MIICWKIARPNYVLSTEMHFKYKDKIKVKISKGCEKIYHVDSKHKTPGEIILILHKTLRELLDPERNISYWEDGQESRKIHCKCICTKWHSSKNLVTLEKDLHLYRKFGCNQAVRLIQWRQNRLSIKVNICKNMTFNPYCTL